MSPTLVRKTAVPRTVWGAWVDFSMERINVSSGTSFRAVFSRSICDPRVQVHITIMMDNASATGTQPPSWIYSKLASRKTVSMTSKGASSNAATTVE
ncbi:hypothetical protein D9M69_617790 [compost metagenome]